MIFNDLEDAFYLWKTNAVEIYFKLYLIFANFAPAKTNVETKTSIHQIIYEQNY
jgi:hypothetical protein